MSILTDLAMRRRPVVILAILLVLVGGIFATASLKIELFPDIEFPVVTVSTFYPSANPEAVARDVTSPLEDTFAGMAGLDGIQSTSSESLSLVIAQFEFGTDMDEVESSLSRGLDNVVFPAGVQAPRVLRLTPDVFPILQLSVLSDRPLSELEALTRTRVVPEIQAVPGVFSVTVTGGAAEQLLVAVSPQKLSELGISLSQVAGVLQANNLSMPVGAITTDGQTLPIRATHRFESAEEIANLVVGVRGGPVAFPGVAVGLGSAAVGALTISAPVPVLLKDIAEVQFVDAPRRTLTRTNGKDSLGIAIVKDPEANLVDVANAVEARLEQVDESLGADVEIVTIFNQAPDVESAIADVAREAGFGAIFAIAVIFLFLLSYRPTLVAAVSIPLSILVGLIVLSWLGISLNIMTLGGLAIAVGRVVDDSIVVLENVYRHIQRGEARLEAALAATREVAGAITASTLTTIVVFVPLAFIAGILGAFFRPFALTVSVALLASLVVALTVVPVLGSIFVRVKPAGAERDTWLQRVYTPILRWSLAHRAYTLVIAAVLFFGSFGFVPFIGTNLFSGGDSKTLNLRMELAPGTDENTTLVEAIEVERELAAFPEEVDIFQTTVGTGESVFRPGGGFAGGGANTAAMIIRLTGNTDTPEVAQELRRRLATGPSGRTITITEFQGGGPPAGGMQLIVTGENPADIAAASDSILAALEGLDGLVNVTSDVADAKPEIVIDVSPQKATAQGLTVGQVAFQINGLLVGRTVTQLDLDGRAVDVVLKARAADVDSLAEIEALPVAGAGATVLSDIADVTIEQGPVQITRSDGKRAARISGTIDQSDTGAVNQAVNRRLDATDLPRGTEVTSGGVFEQIDELFIDMAIAMVIAIFLVYLVMVASLGSLLNPLVIIVSLPLASIGALAALFITQRTLGIPSLMGVLMLVGLVVTNAIVLIVFVEQLRQRGLSVYEALVQGGRVRLRPILMTAFTTTFALLPLAIIVPESAGIVGAELATVVIGGLLTSTFLTLLVVPVVYSLVHGMKTARS